jgi:multiple sugar transport system substrate-binding protein
MKQNEPEYWEKLLIGSPIPQGEAGFSKDLMRKVKERVEVQERPRNRRWLNLSPLLALCVLLVVGFVQREQLSVWLGPMSKPVVPIVLEPIDQEKEITLKVAYFHENTFMMRYGKAYTIRYPNVEVKVVSMGDNGWNGIIEGDKEKMIEFLDKEKPDVIHLSPELYGELAKEGQLYQLDAVMKQDSYDLQNLYSGVTDTLRKEGEGKLYGLSPDYEMNALYYNKELFDKYGIPYPKSGMSWEETLQLAARFPTDGKGNERVYGLMPHYYSNVSQLAGLIAKTKGLSLTDTEGSQVTLHTDAWQRVWSLATDGYMKGYVFQPQPSPQGNVSMEDMYKRNPFITGNAAMAISSYTLSRDLEQAKSQYKMTSFHWDMVNEPVDPARPGESTSFMLGPVYAVNAKSDHQRAAWEMVKLINSTEIAQKLNRSLSGGSLSARLQLVQPEDGHNYSPFYSLKPDTSDLDSRLDPRIQRKFKEAYSPLALQQSDAIVKGRLKVDDALKQLQEEAQNALFKAIVEGRNNP